MIPFIAALLMNIAWQIHAGYFFRKILHRKPKLMTPLDKKAMAWRIRFLLPTTRTILLPELNFFELIFGDSPSKEPAAHECDAPAAK